jgi:hypothetical protein
MLDSGKGQHLALVPRDYSFRSNVGLTSIRGTNHDGRVVLQRVGDADYTLRVRRAGYQGADVPVHVAGSDEEVTVSLQPSAD